MAKDGSVLVADDSAVVRVSVAKVIRADGRDVVERDSAEAARSVEANGLACALLDLDLGDGTGTDVATRLLSVNNALPVAFFTSATEEGELARARALGPVFTKPAELAEAIAWVRRNSIRRS